MNRRHFMQSLVAVLSLPALPPISLGSATAPAAAAVPAHARSWAVYMSTLHGECTPQALQSMLNIPAVEAKKYVTQLIADGVIKPNPILQRSVSELVKTNEDSLLDRLRERLDMKARTQPTDIEVHEIADSDETTEAEAQPKEERSEPDPVNEGEDDALDISAELELEDRATPSSMGSSRLPDEPETGSS